MRPVQVAALTAFYSATTLRRRRSRRCALQKSVNAMPQEITKHKTILDAIERVDVLSELVEKHDGHFKFELDLEVTAYGRNYNGKKVGPYLRMLEYKADEEIIRQGDWGGNTFYICVEGQLDVYVATPEELKQKERGTLY